MRLKIIKIIASTISTMEMTCAIRSWLVSIRLSVRIPSIKYLPIEYQITYVKTDCLCAGSRGGAEAESRRPQNSTAIHTKRRVIILSVYVHLIDDEIRKMQTFQNDRLTASP